jgi:hypothetical protein
MRNIFVKIQNFVVAIAMLFRHPVEVSELVIQFINHKELKRDIDDINRKSIKTLYNSNLKDMDKESKKKEYMRINGSFEKRMIFHVGYCAGLFSELDSMMEHMLFCFEHHIRFEIYADDANFSKPGGLGWEELFEPFCPINHDPLNHNANYRPADYKSLMRRHRIWYKGWYLTEKLKRRTGVDYLTQDIWCMCINDEFKNHFVDIPLFGMKGTAASQFSKFDEIALVPKPNVKQEIEQLIEEISIPEHFVSLQIRGGDKNLEYEELKGTEQYVECIERLGLCEYPIFVFTDDYTNVMKIKELRPNWKVYTLTREDERGYYNTAFNKQEWEVKRKDLIKLLAIVELCKKADYHIGPDQSCVDLYLKSVKGDGTRYIAV